MMGAPVFDVLLFLVDKKDKKFKSCHDDGKQKRGDGWECFEWPKAKYDRLFEGRCIY